MVIGLFGRALNASELLTRNSRFIALSELSNLLFGATIYLFTRSSLKGEPFKKWDLLHYLPALVYSTLIVVRFVIPSDEAIFERYKGGGIHRHVMTFIGIALSLNITYWTLSYRTYLKTKLKWSEELSFSVQTQFFRNFLIALGLCFLTWTGFYFATLFGIEMIEREARNFIWVGLAWVTMFLAFYQTKEPALFNITERSIVKKYHQSRLTKEELDALKARLDQIMEEKKPYLNSHLMKADLAIMLGVNHPDVARLLNENIGMNFFEYINYFRIKEFIQLFKTTKANHLTFFGLAQEAGFNSRTTFNKSFKKLMGISPREYFARELN